MPTLQQDDGERREPKGADKVAHLGFDHRSFVGPEALYDVFSAMQFNLLTTLGLREHHRLLDIGCGSLRGGRLFISYLAPGHYAGIEPEEWLVAEGVRLQLGTELLRMKSPELAHRDDFRLSALDRRFDFLLAQSIFSHATQSQIRTCLSEAKRVLEPEGLFAASFFEGEQDYRGERWALHASYTFDTLTKWAGEAGLHVMRIDWPHPDGQQWLVFRHALASPWTAPPTDALRLKQDLAFCRARLKRLEDSRYLRIGRALHRLLGTLRFRLDRLRRPPG